MIATAPGRRGARRQDLIDATRRVLARETYRDLTVDDICQEAGLSKGAFYGYFPSKIDVLLALAEDETARCVDTFRQIGATCPSIEARLLGFTRCLVERSQEPASFHLRLALYYEVTADPSLRDSLLSRRVFGLDVVMGWVQSAMAAGELPEGDPLDVCFTLNALACGTMVLGNAFRVRSFADVEPLIRRMVRGLLQPVA